MVQQIRHASQSNVTTTKINMSAMTDRQAAACLASSNMPPLGNAAPNALAAPGWEQMAV